MSDQRQPVVVTIHRHGQPYIEYPRYVEPDARWDHLRDYASKLIEHLGKVGDRVEINYQGQVMAFVVDLGLGQKFALVKESV